MENKKKKMKKYEKYFKNILTIREGMW